MAVNRSANGTRLRSKIVPVMTEILLAQPAQPQRPSSNRQPFSPPHLAQLNHLASAVASSSRYRLARRQTRREIVARCRNIQTPDSVWPRKPPHIEPTVLRELRNFEIMPRLFFGAAKRSFEGENLDGDERRDGNNSLPRCAYAHHAYIRNPESPWSNLDPLIDAATL